MRAGFRLPWRTRYFLIGGVAIAATVGLIGWHFFGGRGEVLKSDGGPVVTVMDFGQPIPLDPLPWLATSEILDTFADDDGIRGQGRRAEHAVRNP
jgi:hypothetical protein